MSAFFKTSYATLRAIAQAGRHEDVAGFLVLARHASGIATERFGPYKLSGAGVNSIHEKAGVSEEVARGVVERLREDGYIKPYVASREEKAARFYARWEIVQGDLDLDLPHAFVDPLKDSNSVPPLRRIRDAGICGTNYTEALKGASATELRLDALMVMLAVYHHTRMEDYGGLSPHCVYRAWEIKSQTTKGKLVRWGSEPSEDAASNSFNGVVADWMSHAPKPAKTTVSEIQGKRFWNAWNNLVNLGLVYEAVSLYDTSPHLNVKARFELTLRVNDYHAGSVHKENGDPSLMRELELRVGTTLGFYTPAVNERGEPEAMWVMLPDKRGAVVGVWRPRFRPSNRDVGLWYEKDGFAIDTLVNKVVAADAGQG